MGLKEISRKLCVHLNSRNFVEFHWFSVLISISLNFATIRIPPILTTHSFPYFFVEWSANISGSTSNLRKCDWESQKIPDILKNSTDFVDFHNNFIECFPRIWWKDFKRDSISFVEISAIRCTSNFNLEL